MTRVCYDRAALSLSMEGHAGAGEADAGGDAQRHQRIRQLGGEGMKGKEQEQTE